MSARIEKLTELRRYVQETQGYSVSSKWYTHLSNAINFLKKAGTASTPLEAFRDAWAALYNVFMLRHKPGEEENKALSRWIEAGKEVPEIRALTTGLPTEALETILKAKKHLLWDVERRRWRDAKQYVEAWLAKRQKGQDLSPEKACTYIFFIDRGLRNALGHPSLNPNNSYVKKAFQAVAPLFTDLAEAAIRATIEHPPEGTTGRTTAYRFFLWPFLRNADAFFSDYYLEEIFPNEELGALAEDEAIDRLKTLSKEQNAHEAKLLSGDAATVQQRWLEPVLFPALDMQAHTGPEIVAEEGVFEPAYAIPLDGNSTPKAGYQGKAAGEDLACLIFVLPWRNALDGVWPGTDSDAEPKSALQYVQEALRASDVPWAILTNGQQLRLLRKETAHKPRSFVEVDLPAIMDRLGSADKREDAIRAFRYGYGLFAGPSFTEVDALDHSRLDRVIQGSERHGTTVSAELKKNVFRALEELGEGFRYYLANIPEACEALRQELAPDLPAADFLLSEKLLDEIYQCSLALMYRLLFLFYAESRDLLPMEKEAYREGYSLEALRDEIHAVLDDPDPKSFFSQGSTDLYGRLTELFELVNGKAPSLVPAYNGGLFALDRWRLLDGAAVGDQYLANAINLLSRTKLRPGQGLVKVTYRDLDVRHLGEIYEGILEYHPHIADEDRVILEKGNGKKKYEEYEKVSDLTAKAKQQLKEWQEARQAGLPVSSRNKVRGFKPKGSYFLVYGGRESKRKSSGSYYTPDYIVQYIVENTLGPLVRGENREGDLKCVPLSSHEILELKVLDPAMGSGHFLVAALEYLARAYGQALIRVGKDDDGVMDEAQYTRYKRLVAERCIYGVDLNPLAVELAKLSLWLTTMDSGRPLSFLNHHLKCGHSLLGARIGDLSTLPGGKKQDGQYNAFEQRFKEQVGLMVGDLLQIMDKETLTIADIEDKKAWDAAVEGIRQPYRNIANAWVATYFGEQAKDYDAALSTPALAKDWHSPAAEEHRFFHWELEFPEVWFDEHGKQSMRGGFDAVVAPPYGQVPQREALDFLNAQYDVAEYQLDNYHLFWELALLLVREERFCCLITPSAWTINEKSSLLRSLIIGNHKVDLITNCSSDTFDGVTLEPVITLVRCSKPDSSDKVKVLIAPHDNDFEHGDSYEVDQKWLMAAPVANYFFDNEDHFFLRDIQKKLIRLDEEFDVTVGVKPYQTGKGKPKQTSQDVRNRVYDCNEPEDDTCRLYVRGADFDKFLWMEDMPLRWIKYGPWLAEPRSEKIFDLPQKIILRQTGDSIVAVRDTQRRVCLNNCHTVTPSKSNSSYPLKAALAQLNSSLIDLLFLYDNPERGEAFAEVKANKVKRLRLLSPAVLEQPVDKHLNDKSLRGNSIGDAFGKFVLRAEQSRDVGVIIDVIDRILESVLDSDITGRRAKIERRILMPKGKIG